MQARDMAVTDANEMHRNNLFIAAACTQCRRQKLAELYNNIGKVNPNDTDLR